VWFGFALPLRWRCWRNGSKTAPLKPSLTHFALFYSDLPRMKDLYARVTGLAPTGLGEKEHR